MTDLDLFSCHTSQEFIRTPARLCRRGSFCLAAHQPGCLTNLSGFVRHPGYGLQRAPAPLNSGTFSAMTRPISREAVAAGEGALQTWIADGPWTIHVTD